MARIILEVIKRDDIGFELTFTDVDGNPIDLTGATVFFTVKKNKLDIDDDAVISKEITSFDAPTTGVALLELTAAETNISPRSYFFDVQLKNSDGKISSIQAGRFIISQDVTIRTS